VISTIRLQGKDAARMELAEIKNGELLFSYGHPM
jgi:hypothetical protein